MHADGLLRLIVALSSALALVFGIAVAGKLSSAGFGEFRRGVGRLWFGPGHLSHTTRHLLAAVLLVGEIAVTALLTVGVLLALTSGPLWTTPGFAGAGALLGAFAVAHAVTLARGRSVPCACFGRSETIVGPLSLLRTVLLLALAVAGLALALARSGEIEPAGALVAVPAGLVVGLLLVNLEDLVALFRPTAPPTRPGAVA